MAARKSISKKARFEVFKRDSFTCQYCGDGAPQVVLHVDHIKPVKGGGGNAITNLITACVSCNLGKGARELGDATAVAKQKAQLDELQERREQLEMMSDWRSGLQDIAVLEVDIACDELHALISPYTISEGGKKSLARIVKKHGLQDTIKGIEKSCEINLRYDPSGDPVQDSVDKAINKITGGIRIHNDPPHRHKIRYINGIARNRVRLSWDEQKWLMGILQKFHDAGGDLDATQQDVMGIADQDDLDGVMEGCLVWIDAGESA